MLKVGWVGVGRFGQHHARILQKSNSCEFVGLYDKDSSRAIEIASQNNSRAFADFNSLLNKCDVLVNASSTFSHYKLSKIALKKGIHVFIEKPITSKLWQANELVRISNKKNLKIQVGHIERFNPIL